MVLGGIGRQPAGIIHLKGTAWRKKLAQCLGIVGTGTGVLSSTEILHTQFPLACCAPVLLELMDGKVVLTGRTLNCVHLRIPLVYPERKLRLMCESFSELCFPACLEKRTDCMEVL